jgi:hypothetical protein
MLCSGGCPIVANIVDVMLCVDQMGVTEDPVSPGLRSHMTSPATGNSGYATKDKVSCEK